MKAAVGTDGCFHGLHYEPFDMAGQQETYQPCQPSCRARCAGVNDCVAYSFWSDGGCHLHDASAALVATDLFSGASAISGPVDTCGEGTPEDGECPHDPSQCMVNDVHADPDCCAALSFETPSCGFGFVYEPGAPGCGRPGLIDQCPTCIGTLCKAETINDDEWVVMFASGAYGNIVADEYDFNFQFNRNATHRIIKRECAACSLSSHRVIYYRRYTTDLPSLEFSIYSSMLVTWSERNNVLGVDFDIFSTLADAKAKRNAWKHCNYDDPGIGFPRDCGPSGFVGSQWNSLTRGGPDVEFAVYTSGTTSPTTTGTTSPTTTVTSTPSTTATSTPTSSVTTSPSTTSPTTTPTTTLRFLLDATLVGDSINEVVEDVAALQEQREGQMSELLGSVASLEEGGELNAAETGAILQAMAALTAAVSVAGGSNADEEAPSLSPAAALNGARVLAAVAMNGVASEASMGIFLESVSNVLASLGSTFVDEDAAPPEVTEEQLAAAGGNETKAAELAMVAAARGTAENVEAALGAFGASLASQLDTSEPGAQVTGHSGDVHLTAGVCGCSSKSAVQVGSATFEIPSSWCNVDCSGGKDSGEGESAGDGEAAGKDGSERNRRGAASGGSSDAGTSQFQSFALGKSPYTWQGADAVSGRVASLSLGSANEEDSARSRRRREESNECVNLNVPIQNEDEAAAAEVERQLNGHSLALGNETLTLQMFLGDKFDFIHFVVQASHVSTVDEGGKGEGETVGDPFALNITITASVGAEYETVAGTWNVAKESSSGGSSESDGSDHNPYRYVVQIAAAEFANDRCLQAGALSALAPVWGDVDGGDGTVRYTIEISSALTSDDGSSGGGGESDGDGTIISLTTDVFMPECRYFDPELDAWSNDGCIPLAHTTESVLQCACSHLTVFGGRSKGGSFVKPNLVKLTSISATDIANNPVVLALLVVLYAIFFLALVWAYRNPGRARDQRPIRVPTFNAGQ